MAPAARLWYTPERACGVSPCAKLATALSRLSYNALHKVGLACWHTVIECIYIYIMGMDEDEGMDQHLRQGVVQPRHGGRQT